MALSAIVMSWLDHVADTVWLPSGPLLELGPQDISAARPVVEEFMRRRLGPEQAGPTLDQLYAATPPARPQAEVYTALGFTEYVSVDYGDARADVHHDLNQPLELGRRFAAVTNFGTAEHIFDATTALRSQYRHLDVGGLAQLVLPTFGEINHGFYNFHPTLWTDLAVANAMEIADFQYVDDVIGRSMLLDETGTCRLDFDALPIKPLEGQYGNFRVVVAMNFLRNTGAHMRTAGAADLPLHVLDCCMVALRRTADSPDELRVPQQAPYASPEVQDAVSQLRPVRG